MWEGLKADLWCTGRFYPVICLGSSLTKKPERYHNDHNWWRQCISNAQQNTSFKHRKITIFYYFNFQYFYLHIKYHEMFIFVILDQIINSFFGLWGLYFCVPVVRFVHAISLPLLLWFLFNFAGTKPSWLLAYHGLLNYKLTTDLWPIVTFFN